MLLFQLPPGQSPDDETYKGKDILSFWEEVTNAMGEGLGPGVIQSYQNYFLALEDQAIKTSRKISGSIKGYGEELGNVMHKVYQETVSIGGSTKDVTDFVEQYAETTGRVPPLIKETVVESVKLTKEFGLTTKEIANMVGGFAQLGLSQEFAINMVKKIGVEARKNMVNVDKLTKKVQENLKKSSAYTFKDGVKGLTEMAAKAERLGVKMESAFSLFDKFMDPDKAVEFASEMSMLGGQFAAQFGDPFSNMGADVEELREKLTKAASASAVFNEKTGEFDIPRAGLQALRVFAEQSGESVEDLASVAKQSAKEMRIMNEVGFQPDVSDEDRKLLSSMAEQKDGRWQVQLPGTDDWVDVANINADNMKNFQDAAQFKEKTIEEINNSMLTVSEQQSVLLEQIKNQLVLTTNAITGMKAVTNIETLVQSAAKPITDAMAESLSAIDIPGLVGDVSDGIINGYINDPNGLKMDIETLGNGLALAISEVRDRIATKDWGVTHDAMFPSGGAPVVMTEDEIYQGIVGDQLLMGTNLDKGLDMVRRQQQALANIITPAQNIGEISDPFSMIAKNSERTATLQNKMESPATKLQEIITTSNNNVNISGGANVSGSVDVKVSGNGVNMDDPKLSALIMSKVSAMMEERLSKGWKEKQGNIAS